MKYIYSDPGAGSRSSEMIFSTVAHTLTLTEHSLYSHTLFRKEYKCHKRFTESGKTRTDIKIFRSKTQIFKPVWTFKIFL